MSIAWAEDTPGWPFDADCSPESDHLWERLSDGSWLCVWCDARTRKVGQ